MAVLLLTGLGWGLPDRQRSELLTWGMGMGPAQIKAHYAGLAPAPGRETPRRSELVLSDWHKYQNFCDFILYSAAVDEWLAYGVLSRMNPAALDLRPGNHIYGGAYIYPLGAALFALKSLGLVAMVADSAFYLEHPEQMARLQMAGRAMAAAAYLGALVLLGLWGNHLGGRAAGTLAMAAWAFSSLPFVQALVSKPHVYAAFWGLWGLYLLQRHQDEPRRRFWLGSMACLGLAAGSNIFAWSLALAYPALLYRRGAPWRWLRPCLTGWLGMALVFFITNPYVLLDHRTLLQDIVRHDGGGAGAYATLGWAKLQRFLASTFTRAYAFPLAVLGGAYMLSRLWRGPEDLRRLALLVCALLLPLGAAMGVERIALFTGPPLCLFAGLALARWVWAGAWAGPLVRRAVLALLLLPGAVMLGLHARDVIDHRAGQEAARAWVEEMPPGAAVSVGILGDTLAPNHLPPLPFLRWTVMNLLLWRPGDPMPDYVLLDNYQRENQLARWQAHPLRAQYRLERDLGWRGSYAWLAGLRFPSEARVAAWVWTRQEP